MKKPQSVLEYPIVTRKHLNFMTISMPDLGIFEMLELPPGGKINKYYVTQLATRIARIWVKATKHIHEKKWVPEASDIKSSVKKATTRDLTPRSFAKLVGVSEQTIRRDIERGILRAKKTTGGHRKIPEAQLPLYLEFLRAGGKKRSEIDLNTMRALVDRVLR